MATLYVTNDLGIDIKVSYAPGSGGGLIGNVTAGTPNFNLGTVTSGTDNIKIKPKNSSDHFDSHCDACVGGTKKIASSDTITFSMAATDTSVTVGEDQNC